MGEGTRRFQWRVLPLAVDTADPCDDPGRLLVRLVQLVLLDFGVEHDPFIAGGPFVCSADSPRHLPKNNHR